MSQTIASIRSQISAKLAEKAEGDAAFRTVLLSDPHRALKDTLGVDPVPGFKINVIEEKSGEINIILPAAFAQDELPDELLDLASGGTRFGTFIQFGPDTGPKKP